MDENKILTESDCPSKFRRMSTLSDNLLCFVKSLEPQGKLPQLPFKDVGLPNVNCVVQSIANHDFQLDTNIVGSRRHSLFSNDTLSSLFELGESRKPDTRDHNKPNVSRRPSTVGEKLVFAFETLQSDGDKSSSFPGKLNKVVNSFISDDIHLNTKVPRARRHSILLDLESSLNSLIDLKEEIHQRGQHESNMIDTRKLTLSDNLIAAEHSASDYQEPTSFTSILRRCVQLQELVNQEELLSFNSVESCKATSSLDDSSHSVLQRHVCIVEDEVLNADDMPSDEDALLLQGHASRGCLEPLLDAQGGDFQETCAVDVQDDAAPTREISLCSFSVVIKFVQISTTLTIVCTNVYTSGVSALIKSLSVETFTNIVYATTMVSTLSILLTKMCGHKPPVMLVRLLNTIGALLFFAAGIANLFQWQLYLKQVTNTFSDVIVSNMTPSPKTSLDFIVPFIGVGTSDIRHYMVLAEGALSVLNALFYTVDVVFSVTKTVAKKLTYIPLSRRGSRETL